MHYVVVYQVFTQQNYADLSAGQVRVIPNNSPKCGADQPI